MLMNAEESVSHADPPKQEHPKHAEERPTLKTVSGIYAAVLTPRLPDDNIDVDALNHLITFLLSKGISAFAMNGATGEFCLTAPRHLHIILSTVQKASQGNAKILCGVGAPGSTLAIELAAIARQQGAEGLLLPMPCFFPYQQEDLDLYCRKVAGSTELPVMLYNLPQFTSGLQKETVRALITEVPNIIGIKDSSGSLDILRDLTEHGVDACRIVGNDSVLAQALIEGVCDGVVSGVASAVPELIRDLYGRREQANSDEFRRASRLLDEFIAQLSPFPTPWGLKWIVEARGVAPATFSQPVTAHRIAQGRQMAAWFGEWFPSAITQETSHQVKFC
jgi:4-hydroxy-tetrahydrodipicolinate synthase